MEGNVPEGWGGWVGGCVCVGGGRHLFFVSKEWVLDSGKVKRNRYELEDSRVPSFSTYNACCRVYSPVTIHCLQVTGL